MFNRSLVVILILFLATHLKLSLAQDETFFKDVLSGSIFKNINRTQVADFVTMNQFYHYDITGDGSEEVIIPSKRDGSDWLTIKDRLGKILFEDKMQAYGVDAILYKIKIMQLSPKVKGIVLFYMDGETDWLELKRTARVYLLSLTDGKFAYKLFSGAHMAVENSKVRDQYIRRQMNVESEDLNKDGIKEIIISYETIQHIFMYQPNGSWMRF